MTDSAQPKRQEDEATIANDSGAGVRAVIAEDYAEGMFEEGHNRTATNEKARKAPDYDRAAHSTDTNTPDA